MKPTLFVLAAGMGSRYGGLKQLDGLGPHGETIMDYSIYDAIRSGFGKVVFVIRKLTKRHLTVEADAISLQAVKMVLLMEGKVVRLGEKST